MSSITSQVTTERIDSYPNQQAGNVTNMTFDYNYMYDMDSQSNGRIIYRMILPIICSIGIVGIILTITVLSKKSMSTSTNCYLVALSTTDLIFLVFLATNLIDQHFEHYTNGYYIFLIYVAYSAIIMQTCLLASVWFTVMLAVERYIAICKPFIANKICSVTKARVIIIMIFVLSFICRLPNFWENKIVTVYDTSNNSSLTYMEGTELSTNEQYVTFYPWIIDGFVTSIMPFLLLVILNTRLIIEVRSSTRYLKRNQMLVQSETTSNILKEELQITVMLISIIMVFFLCQAPYVVYTAVVSINKFVAHSPSIIVFRYVAILMLALKSAVNFILYCWFSEKFLASLKKMLLVEKCTKLVRSYKLNRKGDNYFSRRMSSYQSTTRETFA